MPTMPMPSALITDALGHPRKFLRMLPNTTCATCAPRGAQLGVVWENASSGSMTVECEHCGNQISMAYAPPPPDAA